MRRIAITLDAFGFSAHALEQAVHLARCMDARIEGIFIEDIDLIQIAELPFLREVRTSSRSEDAISPGRMEQELRALARRAERLLGEHAARYNVAWSFRIWRGSIDSDLLAADIQADVFALTRLGAALTRSKALPPRSTAVSVLFTGTDASVRALKTAVSLATEPQRALNVLLSAEDEAGIERLQRLVYDHLGEGAARVHFIRLKDGAIADLLDILRDTHSAVLFIGRDSELLQAATLRQDLNRLDCPLLIVR